MRSLAPLSAVLATPAFAHHEVIVATSMMPLMGGLSLILVAALAGLRQKFRGRKRRQS
jgi:hypothetical protein